MGMMEAETEWKAMSVASLETFVVVSSFSGTVAA